MLIPSESGSGSEAESMEYYEIDMEIEDGFRTY